MPIPAAHPTRVRAAAAAVLAAAVLLLLGHMIFGGSAEGTLRAAFGAATQVVPGNEVRIAGRQVGSVESVDYVDGQAVLRLRITDSAAWPLHSGTTADLRYGTTASSVARYVELHPGPASAPVLADGGLLTRQDTLTPVEFDQMYRILNAKTRDNVRGLMAGLAQTLHGSRHRLGPGVSASAGGLDQLASLMRELGADRARLAALVDSGSRASTAIANHDPALGQLITKAATTFDQIAVHASATRMAFDRLPTTLRVTQSSLARLDQSLGGLQGLVDDIRPGARRLRELAPVVGQFTRTLHRVAPVATVALRQAWQGSPPIRSFLRDGTPFLGQLGAVLGDATPQLNCIRPYAPEIAGFFGTWAGFTAGFDRDGHFASEISPQVIPVLDGTSMTSAQVVASTPGVTYAFPRPPGLNVNQPWFIPECGYGPGTLDPTQDPEAAGAR